MATRGKTLKDFGISLGADGNFVASENTVSKNIPHWKAVTEGSTRNTPNTPSNTTPLGSSTAAATTPGLMSVAGQVTPKSTVNSGFFN